ncbi:hypothetical protein [Gimesia panareensis]|uniref:2TM domain-containing protein n=1 Tax=Gimesia panareensis TaxID=2527978 RepID=A0A518A3X8_9PLAN|nr:hypothetical protein [Gimesia panareensis]QDT27761.1 hypothetical protein Enr10x_30910 [Gimesia panareensis]QDU49419.1 hypothetical protein Pan110_17430 [Gimesia panareensis]QDV17362.1 hypothetical protein Pan153_20100 [Gimesia panareensis]
MEIDIQQELAGKNPARVAPQIRKNVRIQKLRVRAHLITTLLALGLFSLHLLFDWLPLWIAVCALIVIPISLLGIYGDWRVLQYQQQKLQLIEEILETRDE